MRYAYMSFSCPELTFDEMIAAADAAGVIFKVFENFIFYPPVQRAKALIDAGEIGDVAGRQLNPSM